MCYNRTKGSDGMYKETFASNLRKARENKGYTQQYVADVLSISRSNIGKYETSTLEPNLETIGQLADLYQVSTDWLFGLDK